MCGGSAAVAGVFAVVVGNQIDIEAHRIVVVGSVVLRTVAAGEAVYIVAVAHTFAVLAAADRLRAFEALAGVACVPLDVDDNLGYC